MQGADPRRELFESVLTVTATSVIAITSTTTTTEAYTGIHTANHTGNIKTLLRCNM